MVDWIQLAQDRVEWWVFVNTAVKLWGSIKGGEINDQVKDNQSFLKEPESWSSFNFLTPVLFPK
jgi:hypothetical protein